MPGEAMPEHRCRICGSVSLRPHFEVRGQRLERCTSCGFVQVDRQPTTAELDAIYAEAYFTGAKYRGDPVALERESARRIALLKRWVQDGATILDAGCSTGDFIGAAKDTYRVYGVDYSAFAVETARKRFPEIAERLQPGKIEDAPWSDVTFDAICLWDVIEHIWDPLAVLSALLSRLNPGGAILFSTPAIDSLFARAMGRYWPFMTPPEHLSFFSSKAVASAARRLGPVALAQETRRGKWANIAFIAHKIARIAPRWFPVSILWPLRRWPFNRLSIYVPTSDIMYVVLRKTDGQEQT